MNEKMLYIVLMIVGFFGTCALTINAHYIKEFSNNLSNVNIGVAQILSTTKSQDKVIEDHEKRIRVLESNNYGN